jgi:hypothetical protein
MVNLRHLATRVIPALFVACALSHCAQTEQVFEPVNNRTATASTAATQGTLTLNISLTAQGANHQTKTFGALLYQNGTLMGGINADGTSQTDAAGAATVTVNTVTASNCITNASPVTLTNGTYDLYFAIQYGAETATYVTAAGCGTGYIQSSTNAALSNLYTARGSVTINGNTTYSVGDSNSTLGVKHTFEFNATGLASKNFRCYMVDSNTTSIASTVQPLSMYTGTTDGAGTASTDGAGGVVHRLSPGAYKYYCLVDMTSNGAFFDSGVDKVATGTLSVTGANTTLLGSTSFANY